MLRRDAALYLDKRIPLSQFVVTMAIFSRSMDSDDATHFAKLLTAKKEWNEGKKSK
jgi:hypothetical protein